MLGLILALLLFILHFQRRRAGPIDPEYTKLSALIDKYKTADLQVVAEGLQSEPVEFLELAKDYLRRRYEAGESAASWVKKNCCQTREGHTLYFKYPDGSTQTMRDVFLEELGVFSED